ncbi:hypothetical protein [Sphingobium sp.]|uniref:hypothetical protein n=1 Tax=Sphingobium sp. TaxID=1912891 RepID=UPI002580AA14|nr:hypothetical protein [Sphingobium sp.]
MILFPLTTMRPFIPMNLAPYPAIRAYLHRVVGRPAFQHTKVKSTRIWNPSWNEALMSVFDCRNMSSAQIWNGSGDEIQRPFKMGVFRLGLVLKVVTNEDTSPWRGHQCIVEEGGEELDIVYRPFGAFGVLKNALDDCHSSLPPDSLLRSVAIEIMANVSTAA